MSRNRYSDEETQTALALFNAGLAAASAARREVQAAAAAETARRKRIEDAELAKRSAAERLRALQTDTRASAEAKAEADAAYREALTAWQRATGGDETDETSPAVAEKDGVEASEGIADEGSEGVADDDGDG